MRLSKFIIVNLEPILQEWQKFAATLVPLEQKKDELLLRDHLKKMLEVIAADLAVPETAEKKSKKSKGHYTNSKKTFATIHGSDRLQSGFSLDAAIAEYRALRASVTRLWQEANIGQPESETTINDIIRFNEAVDQSISESVTSYSLEKEKQTRVFETILSSSPDLSFTFDLDGQFAYGNKALSDLFQLPPDQFLGKTFLDIDMPDAAELQRKIEHVIKTKEQFCGEMTFKETYGHWRFYEYIYVPVFDQKGKVEAVAGTARDITERKAVEEKNWQKANYDLLTGLPNRRLFQDRLEQDVTHAGRSGVPIALIFIDLDHFKDANDQFGHEAGDLLLRLVADRLRSCVRKTDTVARLGGDEFTVILQDLLDAERAEIVAEKILKELANPFQIFNHIVHISGSIGIAFSSQDANTPEQLIKNADHAMYVAKHAGRNRFSFFSPIPELSIAERLRLIVDLRLALPQRQLAVFYQPIFNLADGKIVSAEAFLRWHHPEIGMVLPEQFIDMAETAGLVTEMMEIGNFVFSEAAMRSREWCALSGIPFQISINMSALQFSVHPNTMNWGAFIKSIGLPLHSISVDIKEEVLLNMPAKLKDRIVDLHDAGIELAVQNFGIGNLTIGRLKKFPIDTIKINRLLVHEATANGESEMTAQQIIMQAHKAGWKVIAEGVEKIDQLDWLQEAGCDYAQGYLFSAPVRAEEFEKMLHYPSRA
jgi:diguanylate cyclase (GGDEF)-like protein/PAS domain S-box-containing protein